MERAGKFVGENGEGAEAPCQGHLCKCGRAPWRKGQRNCVFCNREANAKYRESLKRQVMRLKTL